MVTNPLLVPAAKKTSNSHKKFCVLPFIHFATTTEGTCRLCCKVSKFNTINKPDGTPYNVKIDSIDEIWNSDHYKEIRNKVLADEELPECSTCWNEEKIFHSSWSRYKDELPSKRRKENQKWLHREKTRLKDDWNTVVDKPKIRYFDIRLSNLCNLKCRMCWPHFSSQIVKEQHQFATAGLSTHYKKYNVIEWNTDLLWKGIQQNLVALEEITFVGGEPTLHEDMYILLDQLVNSGQSKKIRLKYTTNLTNIQPRTLEYIKHFKHTIVNGSIDGVGRTNEYIRYPSDWTTIETNIFKFLKLNSHANINLTPVIQIYNIFNMYDLIRWYVKKWLSMYTDSKMYFMLNMDLLYDPNYLSVNRLNRIGKAYWYTHTFGPTIQYLDNIIQNINEYNTTSQNHWYMLVELRKKIINIAIYMEVLYYKKSGKLDVLTDTFDSQYDKKLNKKLADYTQQLDLHRKQDITTIIPNFYEFIK